MIINNCVYDHTTNMQIIIKIIIMMSDYYNSLYGNNQKVIYIYKCINEGEKKDRKETIIIFIIQI